MIEEMGVEAFRHKLKAGEGVDNGGRPDNLGDCLAIISGISDKDNSLVLKRPVLLLVQNPSQLTESWEACSRAVVLRERAEPSYRCQTSRLFYYKIFAVVDNKRTCCWETGLCDSYHSDR